MVFSCSVLWVHTWKSRGSVCEGFMLEIYSCARCAYWLPVACTPCRAKAVYLLSFSAGSVYAFRDEFDCKFVVEFAWASGDHGHFFDTAGVIKR